MLGKNILGSGFDFDIEIRLGAGAFVCGEETALIPSIEGERGMPRPARPIPAVSGLWGKPTVINNVETLRQRPGGHPRRGRLVRLASAPRRAGAPRSSPWPARSRNTGLVEVPMGTTLREVVFDIGGGIPGGKAFKAVQTGGPAGGCIPESFLDTPVDYDSLAAAGSIMGSGGMIVMDEDACMVDIAQFFLDFTQDESCGKCTPCREGTKRMLEILERIVPAARARRATSRSWCGWRDTIKTRLALRPGPGGAEPGAQHAQAFPRRVRRARPREDAARRRCAGA